MRPKLTPDERFDARIARFPGVACWLWKGAKHKGYGRFWVSAGKGVYAHRYAYERFVGPIPEGLMILHLCDIRDCVNPAHLRPGTAQENSDDAVAQCRHTFGERRWNHVLTAEDVRDIRSSNETTSALARRYGVTPSAISQTRSGRNWKSVVD